MATMIERQDPVAMSQSWGVSFSDYKVSGKNVDFQDLMVAVSERRAVVVEGNTDYRGTQEYNLALGERRAGSARNYLIELGVPESRIRTISYGEERPLMSGASESDYALNRRADFVLE